MAVSQERTVTPVQVPASGRGPAPDARRVLVVEPQASTRGLMQFGLVRAGFQVTSVRSAEEAERALAQGPAPALVVSEMRLPGLDGVTFCARLRRSGLAEVPVLLLTAQPAEPATAQALAAGAHDVLAKPLFVSDLVSLARLESSRAPGSPTLVASTREVPVAAALRALLAGTRSGRLVLGTSAELLFRAGQIVSAQVRSIQGERAFRRMLFLGEGAYAVHLGSVRASTELGVDLRALCGPWADALAAWRALTRVSIPLEAVLCPDLRALLAQISQLPEEVEPVVRLFDGERTVRAVVLESSLPEPVVLQVTNRLYASGALLPARVARARGLEPMPQRVRTGWDDPVPRTSTPAVPWATGQTPAPNPAVAPTVVEEVGGSIATSGPATEPPLSGPGAVPAEIPGVTGWDSAPRVGEMERAMRSVPLGLEPLPPPTPRVQTPSALPAAPRRTPASSTPPPPFRPPTPPSVPVALEAGEESPLSVAARRVTLAQPVFQAFGWQRKLFLAGLGVMVLGFVGTTVWVRSVAPPRATPPARVPAGGPVVETEVDRLLTRAAERIDAHDDRGAEEAAMRAAAVDPSDPRAPLLLGRIHLRSGRTPQARVQLNRVLDLEPSGPEADAARALLSTLR
ncbi:MAG TPA: response regulator [Myxococcaceae bacterium]|nr:response regulator [Myxococcaceae bacterium]